MNIFIGVNYLNYNNGNTNERYITSNCCYYIYIIIIKHNNLFYYMKKYLEPLLYIIAVLVLCVIAYYLFKLTKTYEKEETHLLHPKLIDVKNEPESEILDRVYYYDSVDSAYL